MQLSLHLLNFHRIQFVAEGALLIPDFIGIDPPAPKIGFGASKGIYRASNACKLFIILHLHYSCLENSDPAGSIQI